MRRRTTPAKKSAAKTASKAAPRRKAAAEPEGLPTEIVSFLFDQLSSEERSEKAWSSMFSSANEEDRWDGVQEHMLDKPHESNHKLRRWKFFGK
ncbi:MAG TPA: hypothetical protein VNI01_00605 [Elusimicrobiota bacterium]|jgi:hypothetical protein|nr:hypothetical protein [Elusimicrobiota bacterium]